MPWYTPEQVEEVRSVSDIVDVIGDYVKLKRTGAGYVGLCPFHAEKTPSFSVNPARQMYKCFGCGASGNVITFLMEYENCAFTEAVEALAKKAGIVLNDVGGDGRYHTDGVKDRLLEINRKAAGYYYAKLKSASGRAGYEYFANRGLDGEIIKKFGLGFAGDGGDELYRYLRHEGYDDAILKETGLFKMDERGVRDKFRNRVMFPIMDVNSRVIGFGGRVMGDAKPKYLNSPETVLFDKGRNLFGLNYARRGGSGSVILCEGYMDVIALHQAGFANAVASLGTAFTETQAGLLKRYADEALLTYDSDAAGVKAALRAIPILRQAGISAKIVNMEPYKDPDEFIKGLGADEFKKRIEQAVNSFFFEIDTIRGSFDFADPDQETKFYNEVAKRLTVFDDKVQRENYLEAAAARYALRRDDLKDLVVRYGNAGGGYGPALRARRPASPARAAGSRGTGGNGDGAITYSYRLLLSWLAESPELYGSVSRIVKAHDYVEEPYGRVAAMLYEQLEKGKPSPADIICRFQDADEQSAVASIFQTGFEGEMSKEGMEKALNELVARIKEYSIDRRISQLKDASGLKELIEEKKALQIPAKSHIYLRDAEDVKY